MPPGSLSHHPDKLSGRVCALRAIVPAVTADSFVCAAQVQNNHHHRVGPFEDRLPFGVAMKHYPSSYLSDENLLPGARRMELSHHLAHAWCAVGTSPWPIGEAIHHDGSTLVVVMDGMGETYGAMRQGLDDSEAVRAAPGGAASAATEPRGSYITDLTVGPSATLPTVKNVEPSGSGGWREAESAYLVTGRDEGQSSGISGSSGAVRCSGEVWRGAALCAARCGAVRCGAMRRGAARCGAARCGVGEALSWVLVQGTQRVRYRQLESAAVEEAWQLRRVAQQRACVCGGRNNTS